MSVQEATAAAGPVTVTGFIVAVGDDMRLCSALAESFPPQCAGPSLPIEGTVDAELQQERDVRWTEHEVSLRGNVADGALRVSETPG